MNDTVTHTLNFENEEFDYKMTTRDLSANVIVEDLPLVPQYERAHGITLGLAFTILYPLGTILIRVLHNRFTLWIHAICQMVGFGLMIAGLATGQRLANILDKVGSACKRETPKLNFR